MVYRSKLKLGALLFEGESVRETGKVSAQRFSIIMIPFYQDFSLKIFTLCMYICS